MFKRFPRLKEREKQIAGTLSGGEQQMLAMGRALMSKPKLLMLDEPSMGLAPILVEQIFDIIKELHAAGTTILLVEQNAQMALSVADRAYVLETGKITISGDAADVLADDRVRRLPGRLTAKAPVCEGILRLRAIFRCGMTMRLMEHPSRPPGRSG